MISIKGSSLRDEYKYQHKQYENFRTRKDRNKCLGFDLDFVEVRNNDIAAFTDVKKFGEDLTWVEGLCYPILDMFRPVLVIKTNEVLSHFEVYRFNHDKKLRFTAQSYWEDFLPNLENYLKVLDS
jgi:hypothetical protein